MGEELLTPTRVYCADLLDLIHRDSITIHALTHITGGGLVANLARVLPAHLHARLDRATWTPARSFRLVSSATFLRPTWSGPSTWASASSRCFHPIIDDAMKFLAGRRIDSWVVGEVVGVESAVMEPGYEVVRGAKGVEGGSVQLVGDFAG